MVPHNVKTVLILIEIACLSKLVVVFSHVVVIVSIVPRSALHISSSHEVLELLNALLDLLLLFFLDSLKDLVGPLSLGVLLVWVHHQVNVNLVNKLRIVVSLLVPVGVGHHARALGKKRHVEALVRAVALLGLDHSAVLLIDDAVEPDVFEFHIGTVGPEPLLQVNDELVDGGLTMNLHPKVTVFLGLKRKVVREIVSEVHAKS